MMTGLERYRRVCVIGAGAVGGVLAFKLSRAGFSVTVVDVGEQLRAIRLNGLTYVSIAGDRQVENVRAISQVADAGPQDAVVLAVKSHDLELATHGIERLFHPETIVLTLQNGIPWWYFEGTDGPHRNRSLATLDAKGVLRHRIEAHRIIGTVALIAVELAGPAVARHIEGNRFVIGELDGRNTERLRSLQEALSAAELKCHVTNDIRGEIWLKALGSVSFNPISALAHATFTDICSLPESRDLARQLMEEAHQVGERLGVHFRKTVDERLRGAEAVGAHKSSMLQDVEAGRPLEIEALIGAILELSRISGTPAPATQAIYACVKLLNSSIMANRVGVAPATWR
jgi:ketopantoate reductase